MWNKNICGMRVLLLLLLHHTAQGQAFCPGPSCRERREVEGEEGQLLSQDTEILIENSLEEDEEDGEEEEYEDEDEKMQKINNLLKMIEAQERAGGESCTPGTELELGENIVDSYGKDRFHRSAMVFINRANWLTRMWKYGLETISSSEFLLYSSLMEMLEFDNDVFAAGNCYDKQEYKADDYFLYCPYAYRLPNGSILAKNLAAEYDYLAPSSTWFYNARAKGKEIIRKNYPILSGFRQVRVDGNSSRLEEEDVLAVGYEDGEWHKPYYDCGGGNIWMMTYTVPFFGYNHQLQEYYFKGTSGLDIDLRVVDINQCHANTSSFNIFGGTDKCKKETTQCEPISGLGFRRGSYRCVCIRGFYFPETTAPTKYYNGTILEEEYEKKLMGANLTLYDDSAQFQCLPCAEGCDECIDNSPCIASLNVVLRTILLVLQCVIIGCLPVVVLFTYKYSQLKVIRAASPVLLRIIILGAFFIYSTTIVLYPRPHLITCTLRIWLREIGFALSYGALMLKTWRISVIFRVRSAKAVKITDMDLIKRLGGILGMFVLFLIIRTLMAPPKVIIGRTADNLKAFLCESNWWDHSFTIMELMILLWGIRLCIMVRKAPSEFNESRFISMTIYNEFLLSIFLNVSMFFLQHPANPDLLYIIFFCHSQLTITILLCLIFASKFYLVMKGQGKELDEPAKADNKPLVGKFGNKGKGGMAGGPPSGASNNSSVTGLDQLQMSDKDINAELEKMLLTLKLLQAKNASSGRMSTSRRITAIQEAFVANSATAKPPPLKPISNGDVAHCKLSEKTPLIRQPSAGAVTKPPNGISPLAAPTDGFTPPAQQPVKPDSLVLGVSRSVVSPQEKLRAVHSCAARSTVITKEVQTEEKVEEWMKGVSTGREVCPHHPELQEKAAAKKAEAEKPSETPKQDVVVIPAKVKNGVKPRSDGTPGRVKGHHPRRLVINLDDKNKFTDEVTV